MRKKNKYLVGYDNDELSLMDSRDHCEVLPCSLERAKKKKENFEFPDKAVIYKLVSINIIPAKEENMRCNRLLVYNFYCFCTI